ncbi:MAG: hypothetical protein L0323_12050 [Planctomycetes bacterium]|nr:hypothetical protein [Planctomycetota bacterium]
MSSAPDLVRPRREALLVVLSMSASALLLLLYVRALSSRLPPSEFGLAGSLLSVLLAASLPFGAIQAAIARSVAARREAGDEKGEAQALAGGARLAFRTAGISVLVLGAGWLVVDLASGASGAGRLPVSLAQGLSLALSGGALALYHGALGTLLGRRNLLPFALAAVAEPALRIVLLRALDTFGGGATEAVAVCIPTAGGIGALVLRRAARAGDSAPIPLALRHALALAAFGVAAYSAPLLADALLDDPDEIGRFFAATHVSRFLVTLPLPFAMAIVRRTAERRAAGLSPAPPFWTTAAFLVVTFVWILANLAAFPGWFSFLLIEPARYPEVAPQLLPLGIGSALYGLLLLPLFLGISLEKRSVLRLAAGTGAALLCFAFLGPSSPRAIVLAWDGVALAALAAGAILAISWLRGPPHG